MALLVNEEYVKKLKNSPGTYFVSILPPPNFMLFSVAMALPLNRRKSSGKKRFTKITNKYFLCFSYSYAHYSIFAESVEKIEKKNLKIVCLQRFVVSSFSFTMLWTFFLLARE